MAVPLDRIPEALYRQYFALCQEGLMDDACPIHNSKTYTIDQPSVEIIVKMTFFRTAVQETVTRQSLTESAYEVVVVVKPENTCVTDTVATFLVNLASRHPNGSETPVFRRVTID